MLLTVVNPASELGFISFNEDRASTKAGPGRLKTWLGQHATTTQGWGQMTQTLMNTLKWSLENNTVGRGHSTCG